MRNRQAVPPNGASANPLFALARRRGIFAAADATRAGVHSQHLTRLLAEGTLERVARGHYRFAACPVTGHHCRVVAAGAAPHGVVCLLSALAFHEIGTQLPSEVRVAIEHRTNSIPRVFAENA